MHPSLWSRCAGARDGRYNQGETPRQQCIISADFHGFKFDAAGAQTDVQVLEGEFITQMDDFMDLKFS